LFKFNKRKEDKNAHDQSEVLDAKLNHIKNNKSKKEEKVEQKEERNRSKLDL